MTPAEHIAKAEEMLSAAEEISTQGLPLDVTDTLLAAIGHTLIALAVENGAPHASAPAVGGQGGS